jgi:flagellar hook-associated protein 1
MADFLSTGVSGLIAFQRALDVTSHNIANVGTDGYSRQRAEFVTRPAHPYGNGWLGSGVEVSTVKRMYDELLSSQVRGTTSSLAGFDAFSTQMQRVNNLFSSTTTGLSASLQKFANAIQDVASSPSSIPARQVLLSEANVLANRLQSYDQTLAGFDREIDARLGAEVTDISTLAKGVADLNAKIALESTRTGNPPNDLLDERDRLLDQLAGHIDITTVNQGDGKVNVFVGSGQPLVLGDIASGLSLVASPYDPTRHEIALSTPGGGVLNITKNISGGTLGGLMDFRAQVLDPTRNTLGRMSVALADVVNGQHASGIDLNGDLGGDLFAVGGVKVLRHTGNEGTGTVAVTRGDIEDLTERDYTLEFTASGWEMRDALSGASIPLTGDGSALDPFEGAGLSIVVGGTPEEGDRFLIQPTRAAAAGLDVLISDPAKVAAASPIRTASAATNSGSVQISSGEILDPENVDLQDLVEIEFISDTQYTINGGAAQNYTSGQAIELNGWSVTLTGTPVAGDSFTVSDNSSGAGDNRNALALADALRRPVLDGGTASLDATATRLVGSIGVATSQAQANRDAQNVISQELSSARDSVSGVNLDEEAANLLRYQQAYQAAAQLIRVASTLFDTLINAVGR